jgi:capsular exopolysaccharide synthesis family protein
MSRVDEALRRAAEQPGGGPASTEPRETDGLEPLEAAALAREPFPIEMPERRHTRSGSLPIAAPTPMPVPDFPAQAPDGPTKTPGLTSVLETPSMTDRMSTALSEKIVIDQQISPASREQYRRLAATLHHAQAASAVKVVMIASAVQGEGKTLTSTNLALTFSESYQRNVLLIDADLRRPTLHTVFGIMNSSGLSEGLLAPDQPRLRVVQASSRLSVLPAGRPSSDPMAGLTSERMRRVIDESRAAFDWVIIDTPPVVLLPDANLLSAMVDVAVLVVKAGSTSFDLVNRALGTIGRERVIGVVLNRAEQQAHHGYGYYYYYGAKDAKDVTPTS